MGLIRVGERLTLVRQAERGQEPNAFDDRDDAAIRRDTADAHLSPQYHQINVRGRRLRCVSGT